MLCPLVGWYLFMMLAVALISRRPVYALRHRRGEGHCQECGYDLAGLESGATCPECGQPDAGAPRPARVRTIVEPLVARRLVAIAVFVAVASLLYAGAVSVAGVWTYIAQGYRLDVALRAYEHRADDDLGLLWLANPWPLAAPFAPLLAFQHENSGGERRVWWSLLCALVAGLVWLAVASSFWR